MQRIIGVGPSDKARSQVHRADSREADICSHARCAAGSRTEPFDHINGHQTGVSGAASDEKGNSVAKSLFSALGVRAGPVAPVAVRAYHLRTHSKAGQGDASQSGRSLVLRAREMGVSASPSEHARDHVSGV
jgi:hypothetical protein